jgi:hypothetical protein
MKAVRIAFVLIAALAATACLPVATKSPIGTTQGFVMDPSLIGTWEGAANGEKAQSWFHFLPGKENTIMAVVVTPAGDTDSGGYGAFALQTVKLGGNWFMNAQEVSDNGNIANDKTAQSTTPLRYTIGDDGKLTLYMLDEKATAAAIKAGKIQGTIEPGQDGDVTITSEPDDLDAFFQTPEGVALFSKQFAVLTKVDTSSPSP